MLCPLYIVRLEFKSKEELQLMPQTEEEHLENESLLDEEQMEHDDEKHADGEVSFVVLLYVFVTNTRLYTYKEMDLANISANDRGDV